MLRQLAIRDFVIVDRLELEFSAGFGALTGETGAGKSILIDALALALGDRADAGVVRTGCDKAEVAATFALGGLPQVGAWLAANDLEADDELLLRRVLDAGGRSRGYINGSPATAQQMREVGEFLVDIHGQHTHQSLLRTDAQRALLDSHAGLSDLVRQVANAYRAWREALQMQQAAAAGAEALAREREQLEWQVRELEMLAFVADEWTALELEHKRLGHAASLIEGARFALDALADGEVACAGGLDGVVNRLGDLADFDPALQEVSGLLQSAQAELGEAISILRRYADRVDLDPARLAEVERRMEAVLACARKYRVQAAELPGLLVGWQARLATLNAAADLDALAARVATAHAEYLGYARELSAGRQRVAAEMGAAVSALMQQLALASGRFEVALLPLAEGAAYGLEQVEFRVGGLAGALRAIKAGASAVYIHGGQMDFLMHHDMKDEIQAALDAIHAAGLPAGVAAHMYTTQLWAAGHFDFEFHMCSYYNPSDRTQYAGHKSGITEVYAPEDRDNMVAAIAQLPKPAIHYKIFAAGRNDPIEAFQFAAKHLRPIDAVCIGVFLKHKPDMLAEDIRLFESICLK